MLYPWGGREDRAESKQRVRGGMRNGPTAECRETRQPKGCLINVPVLTVSYGQADTSITAYSVRWSVSHYKHSRGEKWGHWHCGVQGRFGVELDRHTWGKQNVR